MFTSRHVCVCGLFLTAVTAWLAGCQVQGFAILTPPTTSVSSAHRTEIGIPKTPGSSIPHLRHITLNHATNQNGDDTDEEPTHRRRRRFIGKLGRFIPSRKAIGRFVPSRKAVLRRVKPITLAAFTALSLEFSGVAQVGRSTSSSGFSVFPRPQVALASAPLVAIPKQKRIDPQEEAMRKHKKKQLEEYEQERLRYENEAKRIEATEGRAARQKFEKAYEEDQIRRVEEKKKGLVQLKRDLLDQGICPFVDVEGQRQVILFNTGVDLGNVPGTFYGNERITQERDPKESFKVQKQAHRFIIKNQVEDLKRRGVDPLEYFEQNQDKTGSTWEMPTKYAVEMAREYTKNLQEFGQITVPVEGEVIMSKEEYEAKVQTLNKEADAEARDAEKAAAKAAKAEARALAKAEKAKAREEKRAAKELAKEEKRAAKELAKKEKAEAKMAAAAAASATAATGVAGDAAQTVGDAAAAGAKAATSAETETAAPSTSTTGTDGAGGDESSIIGTGSEKQAKVSPTLQGAMTKDAKEKSGGKLPLIPVASFLVAAGGGGYAFKVYREKAAVTEKQRQEQLKLIMGMDKDKDDDDDKGDSAAGPSWSAPALEEVDVDVPEALTEFAEGTSADDSAKETPSPEPTQPVAEPAKKRRLGIKSMFSKKKNDRETDLNVLLAPSATGAEFASLLAKVLTYGAPGRFPKVTALPGGMPMETFDLAAAKAKLIEARTAAGVTTEESAEVFANVVNCMLIDIVDLASAALKEKDEKVTVDAINVVINFMNHAASLYDSVAEGVVIDPVTYGGELGKGKLEQMYSAYTSSGGLLDMDEDHQDRVGLLQDVFSITDKKAQGLAMKNMQKAMAEMLKDPQALAGLEQSMEGMEGMDEESLKAMQNAMGAGGMPDGMPDMDPAETKAMLMEVKKMKDSGQLPKEELEKVREEFKKVYGSGMDEMLSQADEQGDAIDATERELIDLMKSIMED